MLYLFKRLREILWNISQGNHDEDVCKENCKQNGNLFNSHHIPYQCKYSLAHQQVPSGQIRPLLTNFMAAMTNLSQVFEKYEDQELVKLDLISAQLKAMEIDMQTQFSPSHKIKVLLQKKSLEIGASSPDQTSWNRSNLEHQELVKFDLMAAQYKAMEIEVQKGGRTPEDLEQLKMKLDDM